MTAPRPQEVNLECMSPFGILPLEKRLLLRVWPRGDCWEWRGGTDRNGYGVFDYMAYHNLYVHRMVYELAKGPIPPGLQIDHICRHPWCVKPSHLEAVPQRLNIIRGIGFAGRNVRKTHCPRGHEYTLANTITDRPGSRKCRSCKNARDRKRRQANAKA